LRGSLKDTLEGRGSLVAVPLALNGGIRALNWDPVKNTLLVLSGPTGDGAGDFALWNFEPVTQEARRVLQFSAEIAGKSPEGVCRLSSGGVLVALDGEGNARGGELLVLKD